jgi:hypothetical protein
MTCLFRPLGVFTPLIGASHMPPPGIAAVYRNLLLSCDETGYRALRRPIPAAGGVWIFYDL